MNKLKVEDLKIFAKPVFSTICANVCGQEWTSSTEAFERSKVGDFFLLCNEFAEEGWFLGEDGALCPSCAKKEGLSLEPFTLESHYDVDRSEMLKQGCTSWVIENKERFGGLARTNQVWHDVMDNSLCLTSRAI